MLVVLRQLLITIAILFGSNQFDVRSFLTIWSLVVFALAFVGSITTTIVNLPGKNTSDGSLLWYRVVIFAPYFVAVAALMIVSQTLGVMSSHKSYTEVCQGIFVGDYFSSFKSGKRWGSIVDITNELPRLGESKEYLNIPSWDGCPPTIQSIQAACKFVESCQKPVLIHCAHGKGRSVTVTAAVLVYLGLVKSVDEAVTKVCLPHLIARNSFLSVSH